MNTETLEPITRSRHEFTTPATLRQLLKANLGLNARQVTASKGHSNTWLTITVRDPAVNLAAVKAFAAPFDTSHMDETDYHSGQSVRVETTREVDAAHAAPFIEEIKLAVVEVQKRGCWMTLSNGKHLNYDAGREFWVSNGVVNRGCYIQAYDVKNGTDWALAALALQMARI